MSAVRPTVNQPQVLAHPTALASVLMPACTQNCSVQIVVPGSADTLGSFGGPATSPTPPTPATSPSAGAMTRPNTRGVSVRAPSSVLSQGQSSQGQSQPPASRRAEGPAQATAPRASSDADGCSPFAFWAEGTESCIEGGVAGGATGALVGLAFAPSEPGTIVVGAAFGCVSASAGTLVRKAAMCLTE